MYNALRTGPLIQYILQTNDSGIGSLILLILYGMPLIAIIFATVSKDKRILVIVFILLSLLYGTDFLVLAIAVLIACKIIFFAVEKRD